MSNMKNISILFLAFGFIFSSYLAAADLSTAKSAGLIGEQSDGYIGFVKAVPDDVKNLVKDVNTKRKEIYQQIAKKQKISLSEVEKIGGNKAMNKTETGHYIKRPGEGWSKK